jgi:Tfp pilus assembly ATPase PilU
MPDRDEFERLILALHNTDEVAARTTDDNVAARLEQWLRLVADRGGSDLLLVAGSPPAIRIDGRVHRLDAGPLDGQDIEDAVLPALLPHAREQYRQARIADA